MKKQSARRKLVSNLLGRGLSSLGKTLRTPVSKLTGKQKLLGALGAGGAIAGGKLLYTRFPEATELLSKPLRAYQTSKALGEISGYGAGLRSPVAEDTRLFLDNQVINFGMARDASKLKEIAADIGSSYGALQSDLGKLTQNRNELSALVSDSTRFLDDQRGLLPDVQNRIARNYAGNILLKDYLDGSTVWAGIKNRVPGISAYTGAQDAIKSLVRQDALMGTPDIRNYIAGLTKQDLSQYSDKFKNLVESRNKVLEALNTQDVLKGDIQRAFGPTAYTTRNLEGYNTKVKGLRDELLGSIDSGKNYTLPRGSNILSNLSSLKEQMGSSAEMARGVASNLELLNKKLEDAVSARSAIESAAGSISESSRSELTRLLDSAVAKAKTDLSAYNRYVDKMNLGTEFQFARDLSFFSPTPSASLAALTDVAAGKLKEEALDRAISEIAKKSVARGAAGVAGSAANAALGIGTAIGGGVNRYLGGEAEIRAILDSLNRRNVGAHNLESVTKLFQSQTNERAEVATAKLMEEIRKIFGTKNS